jgi:PAS domain S-box-containing protein
VTAEREQPTTRPDPWLFFDHASEGMVLTRVEDGTVVAANDAWLALTGLDRPDLIGRPWPELPFPREAGAIGGGGSVGRREIRFPTQAGEDRILDVSSRLVEIGGEDFVLCTAADVTEERQLLLDLERGRADLAKAQAMSGVGSFGFDVRTEEVLASDELLRLFWIEPSDFQGTLDAILRQLHPEDVPIVEDAVRTVLTERDVPSVRVRVLGPAGEVRWVEGQGAVELDSGGSPARVFGTAQDVTERVLLERESKRMLARLVELREADRRAIGQEVQDGILQTLSALLVRLEMVVGDLEPSARRDLEPVTQAVRDSMERLRRLVFDVHPTALEHGVGPAVEDLASRMLAARDLEVDVEDAIGHELSEDLRATVYRFLREALTALAPGSAAVRIAVEDALLVEVRHRGPGALGEADRPVLEEAAELAGGTLDVRTNDETLIRLRLPEAPSLPVE